MKQLLLAIIILIGIQTANAQYRDQSDGKNIFISAGGEIGAPSNTPYNFTYGASATAEVKLINKLGLTLSGQHLTYNFKSTLFSNANTGHPSLTSLKAGLRYYTGPSFFFSGELGSTVQSNNGVANMLVYSLGFGFEIPVNKFSDVEIAFSYQNYDLSQYQTTGMKVAYRLGW
jgi:hypothetical protein